MISTQCTDMWFATASHKQARTRVNACCFSRKYIGRLLYRPGCAREIHFHYPHRAAGHVESFSNTTAGSFALFLARSFSSGASGNQRAPRKNRGRKATENVQHTPTLLPKAAQATSCVTLTPRHGLLDVSTGRKRRFSNGA